MRNGLCASLLLASAINSPALCQTLVAGASPANSPLPVSSSPVAQSQRSSRPNIILIMTDDMGAETVGAYGSEYATPMIDLLASQGMLFRNAHATPLCTPSRTRILTGIENARNYKAFGHLDPAARTFGHVLQDAGYHTAIVGKWQLSGNGFDGRIGMSPDKSGFDEALLWQVATGPARGSRYWGPTFWHNGRVVVNEYGFGPELANRFAIDFMKANRERPFFLYYPMVLPHSPYIPTPDDMAAEDEKSRFAAMVRYIDKMVGDLMDALDREGLADNTVIIFTGDNGTGREITTVRNGVSVRGGKGLATIAGTHVPMIVRWPGKIRPRSVSDALFDFMDVMPTLAEIGDTQVNEVDGVSQVPVLVGKQQHVRDHIFMHYAPRWISQPARFVLDDKWKLYGDGRFVALDMNHGTETEIAKPSGEARKRLATFRKILDNAGDGPLDPTRFPMCAGRTSVKPGVSAEIAGCRREEGDNSAD